MDEKSPSVLLAFSILIILLTAFALDTYAEGCGHRHDENCDHG